MAAEAALLDESRSARKRRAILEVATDLFLRQGYLETSMDDVAARAGVSKQTVYKNFADKESIFREIVLSITDNAAALVHDMTRVLDDSVDVENDLREFARRHVKSVMQPRVLQIRRLIISEAGRFPELARQYYERAPGRVLDNLAVSLQRLAERGLLRIEDPPMAANHFAWLILSPLDKAMFYGDEHSFSARELDRVADAGVLAFLAAYRA